MQPLGFEETRSTYSAADAGALIGQARRYSEAGPAYEIVRIVNESEVWICVIQSGEELAVPICEVLLDPIAETLPWQAACLPSPST